MMNNRNEYSSVKVISDQLYLKCGYLLNNLIFQSEGLEYNACSFSLNQRKVVYRTSKVTPTKIGQFVTIWKRNNSGITAPYSVDDDFDFMVITSILHDKVGQFIFPKAILIAKQIVSTDNNIGKRGIRVYPPWYKVSSKQAVNTQAWQKKYFVELNTNDSVELVRNIFETS
ncbi:MAG: MepB family protein [Chitinophagaceae bacterium]